jgi:hypothetical protein
MGFSLSALHLAIVDVCYDLIRALVRGCVLNVYLASDLIIGSPLNCWCGTTKYCLLNIPTSKSSISAHIAASLHCLREPQQRAIPAFLEPLPMMVRRSTLQKALCLLTAHFAVGQSDPFDVEFFYSTKRDQCSYERQTVAAEGITKSGGLCAWVPSSKRLFVCPPGS